MSVGTYISGAAHAGLVGWLVLGWGLNSDPLDMTVTEVSVISGEAFDQALRAGTPMSEVESSPTPVVPDLALSAPEAPEVAQVTPPATETPPAPAPTPEPVTPPEPEQPAEAVPEPVPPAVVEDTPPDIPEAPAPAPAPNLELGTSLRPKPRAVERLAPLAAAAPDPSAIISDDAQQATRPDSDAPAQADAQDQTAPEEAATEVVTEAEKPSAAPEISLRPQARRPRPQPAPQPEAEAEAPTQDADVAAALAAALASDTPAPAQQGSEVGQSLTSTEIGSFLGQIGNCWYIETASTDAQKTTVSLIFELTLDGMLVPGSIQRAGFTGGDQRAADIAYRVAEQAVRECQTKGRSGYDLPADKFPLWRELKIKFNPETMRLR